MIKRSILPIYSFWQNSSLKLTKNNTMVNSLWVWTLPYWQKYVIHIYIYRQHNVEEAIEVYLFWSWWSLKQVLKQIPDFHGLRLSRVAHWVTDWATFTLPFLHPTFAFWLREKAIVVPSFRYTVDAFGTKTFIGILFNCFSCRTDLIWVLTEFIQNEISLSDSVVLVCCLH